jgi:hypothetical protein
MRFQPRLSPLRVILHFLGITALVSLFVRSPNAPASWACLLYGLLLAACLPLSLPQYAEFRQDGLFLRRGWRSFHIPYATLIAVRRATTAPFQIGYLFSSEPIRLVAQDKKAFSFSVAEDADFLTEVMKRCPQLERWDFGLRRRAEFQPRSEPHQSLSQ